MPSRRQHGERRQVQDKVGDEHEKRPAQIGQACTPWARPQIAQSDPRCTWGHDDRLAQRASWWRRAGLRFGMQQPLIDAHTMKCVAAVQPPDDHARFHVRKAYSALDDVVFHPHGARWRIRLEVLFYSCLLKLCLPALLLPILVTVDVMPEQGAPKESAGNANLSHVRACTRPSVLAHTLSSAGCTRPSSCALLRRSHRNKKVTKYTPVSHPCQSAAQCLPYGGSERAITPKDSLL